MVSAVQEKSPLIGNFADVKPKTGIGTPTKVVIVALVAVALIAAVAYAEITWGTLSFVVALAIANPEIAIAVGVVALVVLLGVLLIAWKLSKQKTLPQTKANLEPFASTATSNATSQSQTSQNATASTRVAGGSSSSSNSSSASPIRRTQEGNRSVQPASPSLQNKVVQSSSNNASNHPFSSEEGNSSARSITGSGSKSVSKVLFEPTIEDVKGMFPTVAFYEESFWKENFNLDGLGIDFSDIPPLNGKNLEMTLREMTENLKVRESAGISLLTIPKGITLNEFLKLFQGKTGVSVQVMPKDSTLRSEGIALHDFLQIPSDPKESLVVENLKESEIATLNKFKCSEDVLKMYGNVSNPATYRVAISNHILAGTDKLPFGHQENYVNGLGYQMPELLPATILAGFSFIQAGTGKGTWLCDAKPVKTLVGDFLTCNDTACWEYFNDETGTHQVFLSYKEMGHTIDQNRASCGIAAQFKFAS